MNRRLTPPATPPEVKRRTPDSFAEARTLVGRIRRLEEEKLTFSAKADARRAELLENASDDAKALALSLLKLPAEVDSVLAKQPGDPDFEEPTDE